MVVCVCAGLNERQVEAALDSGATTLDQIGERCGAGLDCGGCHDTLEEMLCRRSCADCPERHSLVAILDDPIHAFEAAAEAISS